MIRITVVALALFSLAGSVGAQAYFEASGRTQIAEFKPGAKIGPVAVRPAPIVRAAREKDLVLAQERNQVVITFANKQPGLVSIAIGDIRGRQLYTHRGSALDPFRCDTRRFATGIYFIEANIRGVRSSCSFMITR